MKSAIKHTNADNDKSSISFSRNLDVYNNPDEKCISLETPATKNINIIEVEFSKVLGGRDSKKLRIPNEEDNNNADDNDKYRTTTFSQKKEFKQKNKRNDDEEFTIQSKKRSIDPLNKVMNFVDKTSYGLRSNEKQNVKESVNEKGDIIYELDDDDNEDDEYSGYILDSEKDLKKRLKKDGKIKKKVSEQFKK
jgi:hypothetical protein